MTGRETALSARDLRERHLRRAFRLPLANGTSVIGELIGVRHWPEVVEVWIRPTGARSPRLEILLPTTHLLIWEPARA